MSRKGSVVTVLVFGDTARPQVTQVSSTGKSEYLEFILPKIREIFNFQGCISWGLVLNVVLKLILIITMYG